MESLWIHGLEVDHYYGRVLSATGKVKLGTLLFG
jgi:hypothetical protein